ncbi:MAG TPA: hypothetical protein VH373_23115 [Jatrophihabitantaceae bacterium]
MSGRSEDDLRAAFAAKATEAPAASDVARAVNQAVHQGRRRRRPAWLVPAVTAAAAVAVGVPLAITLTHGGNSSKEKAGGPVAPALPSAGRSSLAAAPPPGSARSLTPQLPAEGGGTVQATCRPTEVTVNLRRAGTGATLTVTSRGPVCRLDRRPAVQWPAGGPTSGPATSATGQPVPKPATGLLASGATATAAVRSTAGCMLTGDLVRVDWGAGPVEVRATGASAGPTCTQVGADSVQVGEFSGLS